MATLGPASSNEATLRQMILAGLDVVRINFSHSNQDSLVPLIKLIRQLSKAMNVPLAILGDLRGPRIRVGEIEGGSVQLETGQDFMLTPQAVLGNQHQVSISFPHLAQDVEVGHLVLIDDGNIELVVKRVDDNGNIFGKITQGGLLSSRRGLNLPGRRISLPSLTEKDFADVDFAIRHKFDFLALSFVQSAADVHQLNSHLAEKGAYIPVIAKIEKKGALDDIEAIVQEAYGVMVARGDLALEMSIEDIPIAQKRIIAACRQAAVPVITATQMLESMIHLSKPTRAEATDVANAILDGTDAVMLSGETAIGQYPAETIAVMAAIACRTEQARLTGEVAEPPELPPPVSVDASVAYAGHVLARSLQARAIITYTTSGTTARRVARYRPLVPILALSAHPETRQRLALTWGVETALVQKIRATSQMIDLALDEALACHVAGPGDKIVITAGTPFGVVGRTNLIKVEQIPETDGQDGKPV